jgi:hypothetical protein
MRCPTCGRSEVSTADVLHYARARLAARQDRSALARLYLHEILTFNDLTAEARERTGHLGEVATPRKPQLQLLPGGGA